MSSPTPSLVGILRSNPSHLHAALCDPATHLIDYDAVQAAVLDSLASLSCSDLWLLHSQHVVRLEALMQLCPAGSATAVSLTQLFLADKRGGGDFLSAAFCGSPFSSLILVLLRLSVQPASAFPLYPLAPSSASSLLTSLFFCAHAEAHSIRQHILVLLLLIRPPPLRQQLLSSVLLQCLSCSPSASSATATVPALSTSDLGSVLGFICQRVPVASLLSSYFTALTSNAAMLTYKSLPLASHRTFIVKLVAPKLFTAATGRLLFDSFADTVEVAIAQRQSGLLSLMLDLARHCINNLHANGAAAAVTAAATDESDWRAPRDPSAWFDEQMSWVTKVGQSKSSGVAKSGAKRKRKEKYVLRAKGGEGDALQQETLDGEEDEEDASGEPADGAEARRQQRLQQERRRKDKLQQEEEAVLAEQRRRQQQQEAAADRQERVRFVLSCLYDSLATDETSVVTHYLHVVDRQWRGDGLLSEAEADRYCRCARARIGGGRWTEDEAIVLDVSQ